MRKAFLLSMCLLFAGVSMLAVFSHGRFPSRRSTAVAEIAAEIENLASDGAVRRGRSFRTAVRRMCGQIGAVSNSVEEARLLRSLASAVLSVRPYDGTAPERESMAHEYWQIVESVGYRLAESGVSEREVGDFIIAGFSIYRKTCLSFGDADDLSDGTGMEARERRRRARGLRFAWENDTSFFERHSIDMIFRHSPTAADSFRKRWREAFEGGDAKSSDGSAPFNDEHVGKVGEDGDDE